MNPWANPKGLAERLEATLLKADATRIDLEKLCAEARAFSCAAVCVNGSRVIQAVNLLEGSHVKVVTVAGFPLGAADADVKRYETEVAIDNGAQEIDVVLNLGLFKDGEDAKVLRELRDVVEAADEHCVKVILETALLSREEIIRACALVVESGAHFVKTSTGFGPRGVTLEDVRLLRETVGAQVGVKAAGGVRDTASALALLEAGATRLGTSSMAAIINGLAALRPS